MNNWVTIHQPNFLPWPGYWLKLALADVSVVHANCKLDFSGFTRRVKLYTHLDEPKWLSVPLEKKSKSNLISEIKVQNKENDQRRLIKKLEGNYQHLRYFARLRDRLVESLMAIDSNPDLATYNQTLEKAILPSEFQFVASRIDDKALGLTRDHGPLRLVEICEKLKASTYVSGLGARSYLREDHFSQSSTSVIWFDAATAVGKVFPEVRADETVVRIISQIGAEEFANRISDFSVRFRKLNHKKFAK